MKRIGLRRVHPSGTHARHRVEVGFELKGGSLLADFRVEAPSIHANPAIPRGVSHWGLWEWDVVELFLSVAEGAAPLPYLEVQLSPLGQHVELLVHEPRVRWDAGFRSGFNARVRPFDSRAWEAGIEIPLKALGWSGDPARLRGGAFAILGGPGERECFGLFLPEQEKPDFHLPEFFRKIPLGRTP
jgi:hypothetical protein